MASHHTSSGSFAVTSLSTSLPPAQKIRHSEVKYRAPAHLSLLRSIGSVHACGASIRLCRPDRLGPCVTEEAEMPEVYWV